MSYQKTRFDESLYTVDKPNHIIDRDLQRIVDLWEQYNSQGLNSYESDELWELMEQYGFEAYHELSQITDYKSPY